jgi:hypothetical protein
MKKCILVLLLSCLLFSCEKEEEEEVKPVITEDSEKEVVYDLFYGKWKSKEVCYYGFKCSNNTTISIEFMEEKYVYKGDTSYYSHINLKHLSLGNNRRAIYYGDSLWYEDRYGEITFIR